MDLMVYKGLLAITVYFERESASTFSLELWTMSGHVRSHQLTWFHLLETAEYVYEEGQNATSPCVNYVKTQTLSYYQPHLSCC
ncbi:hypothetical protein Peur_074380 [Populus x canadensis]